MENNNSIALKSGIWYTIANFLMKSIVFITTPIFTRLLTHEDFGLYNNFTSWLSTFMVFVTLNLESTFISAKFEFADKFDEYILSVLALSSCSGVVWLVLINIFSVQAALLTGVDVLYLNLMILYLLALPAVNMFQGRERYEYKYKISVLISLAVSILTTVISVALVVLIRDKLAGRIIGTVAPTILIGCALYIFLIKKGKRINVGYWRYAMFICLPFIPHLLSLTLLNSMDRMMITRVCGAEDNALYSLAYTCGTIITLLMSSMNTAFSPWLGEKLHTGATTEIYEAAKKYILLFTSLAAGIMLITPEVLLIMGGRSYQEAVYVMPPVAFGCICQFLYTMFVNIEQFKKKTVGMAFASVSAALLNYMLNCALIPQFGYIAAAYTTLISFLWLLLVHMYLVKRLGLIHVYPLKYIITVLLAMSLYTVIINFLYELTAIRYLLILGYSIAFVLIGWKYRDKILALFKRR